MAEAAEAIAADPAGIERTPEGAIADQTAKQDQSSQTTNQDSTAKPEGETSLLNQKEAPKPEAKKEGEEKKDDKSGAPEAYADYTMPEGFALDPKVKTRADTLFHELGLNQEGAQKAVDLFRELTTEAFNQPFQAYQDMRKEWRDAALAHPDLKGKLGAGQEVNVRIAKMLDGLPDQGLASEFKQVMDTTGAGDHPAFIRVLNYLARQSTEGAHVAGNGPTKASQSAPNQAPPSAAAALWPNLKPAHGG